MEAKKIIKNTIKLVLGETAYGLLISLICVVKNVIQTLAAQGAATSEIQRLKGEMPMAVSEILMRYNNSLHLISNCLIFIIVILMAYAVYNYIVNTYFGNKEANASK